MDGRRVGYACGERRVRDEAWFTHAPVAALGVHTVSIRTHSLEQALVYILAVRAVHSLVTLRTVDERDGWFLWTLLTFVKSPGRPDGSTALLLLSETWQGLPTLTSCGLLEAATQCVLGGDGRVMGDLVAMLAGVPDVVPVVLDLLAALGVVVGVAGGGGGA